jgi:hypothetical protein
MGAIVTADEDSLWVSDRRQAPAPLNLSKRTAGKNVGFVVPERIIVC